jgi:hypothetical protein
MLLLRRFCSLTCTASPSPAGLCRYRLELDTSV